MSNKKIAICHYRVGGTDGVSLEIEKRKKILETHGCDVKYIAGTPNADYSIHELAWDNEVISIVRENSFISFMRKDLTDREIKQRMKKLIETIKKKLDHIQEKEKFDCVLIQNLFSLGWHTAAAKAFALWIEKHKIPTIATHHDFYWERKDYHTPRNNYVKSFMHKYMPPKSKYIKHIVINSLAKRELRKRSKIDSEIIPDVLDFNQPHWKKDTFNQDFLQQFDIKPNDLIIFQGTRVIPRKGIELAIDYAKNIQKKMHYLHGKKLYNGKRIGKKSNAILIIAGYAENDKRIYMFKLKTKCFEDQVRAKFIAGNIKSERAFYGGIKTYSLWDAYVYADIVTFPSIWEGWGNQFIEGIFARKPMVVFEYPVFNKDIKPEGYKYISLGNKLLEKDENDLYRIPKLNMSKAVKKTMKWLVDPNLNKKIELNYRLGRKFHDYKVLEDFFVKELNLETNKDKA